MARAFVTGLAGTELTADEARFAAESDPWGLILFRRNVSDREQLKRLIAGFRSALGRECPVLIDQEGGRVQRMTQPNWPKYPSAAKLAIAAEATGDFSLITDSARAMAHDLAEVGITIDCMPCLDLGLPGITPAIGDRAYSGDPKIVTRCGRAAVAGMIAGGVLPVIKHMPGHGRATVDSHHDLPVVTASLDELAVTDFVPFVAMADLPAAMTAHITFTAVDPDHPVTQSKIAIDTIIRGMIGFDGLLFSDDMSMNALAGNLAERTRRALDAGCDLALHCNGIMAEMLQVAAEAPLLEGKSLARADAALSRIGAADKVDVAALHARIETAMASSDQGRNI